MNSTRLLFLLQGYLRQTLTPEQQQELAVLIAQSADEQLDLALTELWEKYEVAHQLSGKDARDILARIIPPAEINSFQRRRKFWYMAAASILLLLGLGAVTLFYYQGSRHRPSIASAPLQNDVPAPTGSRTTLTLASGRQIDLDSAGQGTLAAQGVVTVTKSGRSGLSYAAGPQAQADSIYYNTISTGRGGQSHVTLADGTQVWLDAVSSLRFPTAFTGTERAVELTGEAYFEVVHKSGQPFRIKVNDLRIEDIGTRFNVFAYANEPRHAITLIDGGIKVESSPGTVLLRPGEQAVLAGNDGRIKVIPDADVEQATAWKQGLTSFHGADIATIMRAMERWYDIKIEIKGIVPTRSFRVEVSRDAPLSQLLKVFDLNSIHYTFDGAHRKLTVTP